MMNLRKPRADAELAICKGQCKIFEAEDIPTGVWFWKKKIKSVVRHALEKGQRQARAAWVWMAVTGEVVERHQS